MTAARDEYLRTWQRMRDLERVVADQRRYIKLLEEQLAPHLVHAVEAEQLSLDEVPS